MYFKNLWVHENIIISRDLSETHRVLTCLIKDPSESSTFLIGDQIAYSEIHQRPQHASSETYMTNQRHIEDQLAWSDTRLETYWRTRKASSETKMPDWRHIGDLDMLYQRPILNQHAPSETNKHALLETHWKQICLIKNPPETDMPD